MQRRGFTVQESLLPLGKRLHLRPTPTFSPLTFPEAVFLTLSLVLIIYPLNLSSVQAVFGWEPQPQTSFIWLSDFGQVS